MVLQTKEHWDGWLESYPIIQANNFLKNRVTDWEPWLIVMHSGAKGPGVAEYFARQQVRDSAHFAWSIRYQGYAQCVNLYHVAWHCAGSRLVANNIPGVRNAIYSKLNWNAIGIELPGPYDKIRGEDEFDLTRLLIEDILNCPLGNGIKAITRHRDIDMGKKDPGKGFTWEWVDDFGLYIFEHRRFSVK